jgi:hypothetical protein
MALPHFTHRTLARNWSLEASAPHLIMSGVSAMGARRKHATFRQQIQSQGAAWRFSSSVGGVTLV